LRSIILSAAVCLCTAAASPAQAPTPVVPVTPTLPDPALVVSGPDIGGHCLQSKCCGGAPCTPEVKVVKKTVYSCVSREYCLPTCSLFSQLMKCCGMADDCDCSTGETRTKTLLVKKLVPKCDEGCGTCLTPAPSPPVVVAPMPVVMPKH